jgi:hypothetical protein
MQSQNFELPTSFQEAKANAVADPLGNKMRRVENLIALENTATEAANNGAKPLELSEMVNQGQNTIAALYPDIPEYEKAVSAAGRYKANRAADNPQDTIDEMPSFN